MSRLRPLGLGRAAAVFGAAIAFPFLVTPDWLVNIGVFTLMYAGLATAWNLFSGFTGYISLGQAAFFGIGAYALAITFEHVSIGGGYRPFYSLPLILHSTLPVPIQSRVPAPEATPHALCCG